MPMCCPDRARMWAQPALRKSSAIDASRSSRTPAIRASSSGPAVPPPRCSASTMADLMRQRARSCGGAGAITATSPPSTKASGAASASGHAPPPPRAAMTGLPSATDTDWPRISEAGMAPRMYRSSGPQAVTRAPSRPCTARSSMAAAVWPEAVRRGSAVM